MNGRVEVGYTFIIIEELRCFKKKLPKGSKSEPPTLGGQILSLSGGFWSTLNIINNMRFQSIQGGGGVCTFVQVKHG